MVSLSATTRLLPYVFLCTIGPSITAATSLRIVRLLMCEYHYRQQGSGLFQPSEQQCSVPDVKALTSLVMAGLATLDGVVSFLSSSFVQRLADRHGRRPLLIGLPLLATVSTLSMVAAYALRSPTWGWLLLAGNGIFVSANTKSIFVPSLCIADVTADKERSRSFSVMESMNLLGPGVAFVIAAVDSRYSDNVYTPYLIALACQVGTGLYAALVIPETLPKDAKGDSEDDAADDGEPHGIEEVLVAPVKPLRLVLPHRGQDGRFHWRMSLLSLSAFATTCGTVYVATASLLFLTDKFNFATEKNSWVLAYLTFSRFAYLALVFPFALRLGRYVFRRAMSASDERAPLLRTASSAVRQEAEEANHFDVIMALLSVALDAVSLLLVSMSRSAGQVLGAFAILALGAGDIPTLKSAVTAAVSADQTSQALAALDMVVSVARLVAPLLLGSVYADFVQIGKPELVFLVAGAFSLAGAIALLPLALARRKT